MNTLGIYFGPQIISVVETKGKQLVNNIGILRSSIVSAESSEEKVPEEKKILALLKDELKRKKIETKDTTITLSGKDLIIRSFEIPSLPRGELDSAVNFEVRKYIPFKVEDLISDFQFRFDRSIKRNRVLFVGIKKEMLDKYIYIAKELGLKINAIEYSTFSSLRLLKLSEINERGIIANIDIGLAENDEANFIVLENGFPLFSRDIALLSEYQESAESKESHPGIGMEKLKREIRISLDYYDRTFPLKSINKVFVLLDRDYHLELEAFIRELGLPIQFINFDKCVVKHIGKPVPFSLSFIKAYCSSLIKINTAVKINLLSAKEKATKKIGVESRAKAFLSTRIFKKDFIIPVAALFVCVLTFLFGAYRTLPLKNDLNNILNMRPSVSTVSAQSNYEELSAAYSNYKARIGVIVDIVKQQLYVSEVLEVIPRLIPEDVWLTDFFFKKEDNQAELILRGSAYCGDSSKELELVNTFLSSLKNNQIFTKYFTGVDIVSIDSSQGQKMSTTNFVISCRK